MKFRISDCEVKVDFLFFAMVAAAALSDRNGMLTAGISAALLHELGHLAAMLLCGLKIKSVSILAAGFQIGTDKSCVKNGQWLFVCVAGAGINVIAAAVCGGLCAMKLPAQRYMAANIALALLSMLPAEPFDGGEILRTLLLKRADEESADRIMTAVTLIVLIPTVAVGALIVFESRYNFSLLALSLWAFALILQRTLK